MAGKRKGESPSNRPEAIAYREKVKSGAMTRRQEVTRLEVLRHITGQENAKTDYFRKMMPEIYQAVTRNVKTGSYGNTRDMSYKEFAKAGADKQKLLADLQAARAYSQVPTSKRTNKQVQKYLMRNTNWLPKIPKSSAYPSHDVYSDFFGY